MGGNTTQKCVAEFVGTYLLVFTIGCNVLSKTPVWAPVSIACVLMVSIYALGGVSGANFNPAVSLAIGLSTSMKGPGDMKWGAVGAYIVVQILAGIVAAFSYAILFWNAFNLGPNKGFGLVSSGLCELLYTFMLCFVVLNTAVARKYSEHSGNQFYGLSIGFVIIAGAYGAGAVSGGCFNPAVAIGIDLSSAGLGIGWFVPYMLFEFAGAALAVVAFKGVRPEDFGAERPGGRTAELLAEFLGTFFLVLTVGLNVLGNSPAGAFSIAASLMCMIYALGDVSGANFNPAVTLAIFLSKKVTGNNIDGAKLAQYMGVQVFGGVSAAIIYSFIHNGRAFPLGPMPGYRWGQAAVAEIIFTFVLCFVVLCTAVFQGATNSKHMFGLAIGSCVTVGGFAIGSISGGSLNPAVSFGIASLDYMHGGFWKACAYTIFEFVGAAAAAGVISVTHQGLDSKLPLQ